MKPCVFENVNAYFKDFGPIVNVSYYRSYILMLIQIPKEHTFSLESAHLISLKIAPHLNNVFLKINRISFDILIVSNKMTCKKNPTHLVSLEG